MTVHETGRSSVPRADRPRRSGSRRRAPRLRPAPAPGSARRWRRPWPAAAPASARADGRLERGGVVQVGLERLDQLADAPAAHVAAGRSWRSATGPAGPRGGRRPPTACPASRRPGRARASCRTASGRTPCIPNIPIEVTMVAERAGLDPERLDVPCSGRRPPTPRRSASRAGAAAGASPRSSSSWRTPGRPRLHLRPWRGARRRSPCRFVGAIDTHAGEPCPLDRGAMKNTSTESRITEPRFAR